MLNKLDLKSVSSEDLVAELISRCKSVNKVKADLKEDREKERVKIYMGHMREFDKIFVKWINSSDSDTMLRIPDLIKHFRKMATVCSRLDKSNYNKNVQELFIRIKYISPEPEPPAVVISDNNVPVARAIVNKQVKTYCRQAFKQDNFDMSQVYLADAADMLALAQAIYRADLKKAARLRYVDTNVREDIPNVAWEFLEKHCR